MGTAFAACGLGMRLGLGRSGYPATIRSAPSFHISAGTKRGLGGSALGCKSTGDPVLGGGGGGGCCKCDPGILSSAYSILLSASDRLSRSLGESSGAACGWCITDCLSRIVATPKLSSPHVAPAAASVFPATTSVVIYDPDVDDAPPPDPVCVGG